MAKTSMQELIEYVTKYEEVIGVTATMVKDKATNLLELEKKQIVEAWTDAFERSGEGWNGEHGVDGEHIDKLAQTYYTETYGK